MANRIIRPARPVYITAAGSCAGKEEREGPLGGLFDMTDDGGEDRFGMESYEKSEAQMQRIAVDIAMGRCAIEEADAIFAGDLQNQCAASSYANAGYKIPFFGLFGACSTSAEALILAAIYSAGPGEYSLAVTSSHYCSAERQFRFPLEYGAQRPQSAQWTVTAAGAFVVSPHPFPRTSQSTKDSRSIADEGRCESSDPAGPSVCSGVEYTAGDGAIRAFAEKASGSSPDGRSFVDGQTHNNHVGTASSGSDTFSDAPKTVSDFGGTASPDRSLSAELAPPFPETGGTDTEFSAELVSDPPAAKYRPETGERAVEIAEMLPGISLDYGVNDAADMGAAMAPAACDTIVRYLTLSRKKVGDFDMILTGDLGHRGLALLRELLLSHGIETGEVLNDCGAMIYDAERQDKHAGGSGCGCSASVLAAHILPRMRRGELGDVLFVATGALMNPQALMQGENIVGIAHLVHLKSVMCGRKEEK